VPDRYLYHFTHVDNLTTILEQGGLLCDRDVMDDGLLAVEVGDTSIKDRRRYMSVPKPPGGSPCDYVPFYFATKSPMLFRISRGGVVQYPDGDQEPLVYIVTSVEQVVAADLDWVFSDGNCASGITDYYDELSDLETAIDWPLMQERYWRDTADDPDRVRRRMAEFLVHRQSPWDLVIGVATRSQAMADAVQGILQARGLATPIAVRPSWYY
jgi:hypothetical protein